MTTNQLTEDLLCCAFEGGVGYWAQITKYDAPPSIPDSDKDAARFRHVYNATHGGTVHVLDYTHTRKTFVLDGAACKRGWDVMREKYPRHYANAISENSDAETGDVFLQCALFGKLIFG